MGAEATAKVMGAVLTTAVLVLAAGCGERVLHPADTIEAYRSAVDARDAGAVYAMLDESARMGMDEEAFEEHFEAHYDAIRAQARRMARAASQEGALRVEAEVQISGGIAPVVWADGDWALARETPTRSSQDTPRDTLLALLQALDARDLEGLVALLSHERRTVYIQELDVLRDGLKDGLGNAVITTGDTAVLPLNNGDKVLLVREDGVWRVQGYEQAED